MLNHYEIITSSLEENTYSSADSIVLMLCRECTAHIGKLNLSQAVYDLVKAYTDTYTDIYDVGALQTLTVFNEGKLINILIAGCGIGSDCKPNNFRKAAGEVARVLHKQKSKSAVIAGPIFMNAKRSAYVGAVVEGMFMGAYTFAKYKSDAKDAADCRVKFINAIPEAETVITQAQIRAGAVCYARDFVNEPGNVVVPKTLAQAALELSKTLPLEVDVLNEAMMSQKGMNALLAVGQGSKNESCLVSLRYRGAGDAPFFAYVGKGITFDSGGISIKPDDNMGEMKDDMTGAGVVLGAMKAIAELGLKCNVIGIMACAENMPDGHAQRPGDIVRAANGKTIEVISTDAEGRMVLADAVWYAGEMGAAKIVDIATLTGGVIVALGKETSGIVANDGDLVEKIKLAGKFAGESYWQLPSLPECKEAIKSDVADLLNSAGREASTITGGLFIGEFVKPGVQWAHIDIGGTSTAEKTEGQKVKGGTGFGTLTLIKLAELGI